jgi:aspartate 4-decarboxylase
MQNRSAHRYAGLSPFELKNELIALAKHRGERLMLNAGRGNPNWLALEPRAAFVLLAEFALAEARRTGPGADLGGLPKKQGIAARLRGFLAGRADAPGAGLLLRGADLASDAYACEPDFLVAEWVDGVLGDHYPVPVRMLAHAERLVHAYLAAELFAGGPTPGRFDLFAVEGASAGIAYVFQSLVESGLLVPGDRIALGVPIFTPYLEVPRLAEYRFELVEVAQEEGAGWRYPPAQLDKLRDPRVKAFLAVNPSNPTAVAMAAGTLERIGEIVRERPDLILMTDDVYAPFVEGFRSLATVAPRNTILLYSFSKFWGATPQVQCRRPASSPTHSTLACRMPEAARAARVGTRHLTWRPGYRPDGGEPTAPWITTAGLSTPQQVR